MNIRLREVEPGDLPLFFAHQQDPEAAAMAAFRSRDRAAFDQHWAKTLANPENMVRTVVVDDEIAGNVCSFTRDGKREVGYWIDRAYWGGGVATAALSAYLAVEDDGPDHVLRIGQGLRPMLVERGAIAGGEGGHGRGDGILLVREEQRQVAGFDFT